MADLRWLGRPLSGLLKRYAVGQLFRCAVSGLLNRLNRKKQQKGELEIKFVHFGFRPQLPRVLKNGLRMSRDGSAGAGVYATPMMYLDACFHHGWSHETGELTSRSMGPISNMRMWEALLKARGGAGRGKSTVRDTFLLVFELPDRMWPITLQVWSPNDAILQDYKAGDGDGYRILEAGYTCRVAVDHASALGRLLHGYSQHKAWWVGDFDTFVEVCIPHTIPPRFFKKVIPLYRTNKAFKAGSHKSRRVDAGLDEEG